MIAGEQSPVALCPVAAKRCHLGEVMRRVQQQHSFYSAVIQQMGPERTCTYGGDFLPSAFFVAQKANL